MTRLSQQTPPLTRPTPSNAGWLRRFLANCGFELNYVAAGMFIAGVIILIFGIHSILTQH